MRLIDADALLIRMKKDALYYLVERYGMSEVIEAEPTVDAEPVRHGRWIPILSYNHTYKCSECGRLLVNVTDGLKKVAKHYPYCHCGAKMESEEE